MGGTISKKEKPTCGSRAIAASSNTATVTLKQIIWGGGANGDDPTSTTCNIDYGICRSIQSVLQILHRDSYLFIPAELVATDDNDTDDSGTETEPDLFEKYLKIKFLETDKTGYTEEIMSGRTVPYLDKIKSNFEWLETDEEEKKNTDKEKNIKNFYYANKDKYEEQEGKIILPSYLIDTLILEKLKDTILHLSIYYIDKLYESNKKIEKGGWVNKNKMVPNDCYNTIILTKEGAGISRTNICNPEPSSTNNDVDGEPDDPEKFPHTHELCSGTQDIGIKLENNEKLHYDYNRFTTEGQNLMGPNGNTIAKIFPQDNHWSRIKTYENVKKISNELNNEALANAFNKILKVEDNTPYLPNITLLKDDSYKTDYDAINGNKNEFYFIKNTIVNWINNDPDMKKLYRLNDWVNAIQDGVYEGKFDEKDFNRDLDYRCKTHLFGSKHIVSEDTLEKSPDNKWTDEWSQLIKKNLQSDMEVTNGWWESGSEWNNKCRNEIKLDSEWMTEIGKKIETENPTPTIPSSWWDTNADNDEDEWKSSKIMNSCKNTVDTIDGDESPWKRGGDGNSWSDIAKTKLEKYELKDTDDWWKKRKTGESPWITKCRDELDLEPENVDSNWYSTAKEIIEQNLSRGNIADEDDDNWWKGTTALNERCMKKGEWNKEWSNKAHTKLMEDKDNNYSWTETQNKSFFEKKFDAEYLKIPSINKKIQKLLEEDITDGKGITDDWWKNKKEYESTEKKANPWQSKCRDSLLYSARNGNQPNYGKDIWSKDNISEIWGKTFHSGADIDKLKTEIKTSVELNKLYNDYDIKNKTILGDIDKKKINQSDTIKTETQNKDKLLHFIHSTKNKINSNTGYKNAMIGILIIVIIVTLIFGGLLLKKYNLINLKK